jgi:diacylglycerol kinase family enzyme
VLLINPRSGDGKAARAGLADRARERGVEPIMVGSGEDLAAVVAHALDGGADALGMAGGDGSLALVAAAAAKRDVPFVCLPAGTRNHFARDLGIARHDLVGALDAFTAGLERRIDIAEVNGRPFLNNLSLGIYGDAVRRSGYREAKVRTILEALDEVLTTTAPAPGLSITDDEGRPHPSPLVVLVSNNPYALGQPLVRGSRPRLDTGRLGVVVVDRPDRPGAARQAGHVWVVSALTIEATVPVSAGLDGESVTLQPPLRCTTRMARSACASLVTIRAFHRRSWWRHDDVCMSDIGPHRAHDRPAQPRIPRHPG